MVLARTRLLLHAVDALIADRIEVLKFDSHPTPTFGLQIMKTPWSLPHARSSTLSCPPVLVAGLAGLRDHLGAAQASGLAFLLIPPARRANETRRQTLRYRR